MIKQINSKTKLVRVTGKLRQVSLTENYLVVDAKANAQYCWKGQDLLNYPADWHLYSLEEIYSSKELLSKYRSAIPIHLRRDETKNADEKKVKKLRLSNTAS